MATYRWLTLAAAIVITVLEAWSFTAASAVAPAPGLIPVALSANDRGHRHYERGAWGSHGVRISPAQVASERRLKPHR